MKNLRKIFLTLFLCFCILPRIQCKPTLIDNSVSLLPGVKVGYNLGAGIDFGVTLGVTFFNYSINNTKSSVGADLAYDFFFAHTYLHPDKKARFRAISICALNNINNRTMLKLGISKTSVKWGMENRNKSQSNNWGFSTDISFAPIKNNFFIGYHGFLINNGCMGLGIGLANILYVGYTYPVALTNP